MQAAQQFDPSVPPRALLSLGAMWTRAKVYLLALGATSLGFFLVAGWVVEGTAGIARSGAAVEIWPKLIDSIALLVGAILTGRSLDWNAVASLVSHRRAPRDESQRD